MGNQCDKNLKMEGLEQSGTSALQRDQREAKRRGRAWEKQILTKPGSAELCSLGREETMLGYTKTLKTASGALQASECHHPSPRLSFWMCAGAWTSPVNSMISSFPEPAGRYPPCCGNLLLVLSREAGRGNMDLSASSCLPSRQNPTAAEPTTIIWSCYKERNHRMVEQ